MDHVRSVHQNERDLYLDGLGIHYVPGKLVSQLTVHQLEGVRYLYAQLRKHSGIFLNDESGLGKCYQTVAFLSAVAVDDEHSFILCPDRDRLHHWSYHLDALAPTLRSKVHPKSRQEVATELAVLQGIDWQYVVVDETRGFMTERELERLLTLEVQRYIFVCSRDLQEQLDVLSKRLQFCFRHEEPRHLRTLLERQHKRRTRRGSFKSYLCTRRFVLRRFARNYRHILPLVRDSDFRDHFRAWAVANDIKPEEQPIEHHSKEICKGHNEEIVGQSHHEETAGCSQRDETSRKSGLEEVCLSTQSTDESLHFPSFHNAMTPDATSPPCGNDERLPKAVPIDHTVSEPLFEPNETNTELMPVLRVESDTPSDHVTIPETDSEPPDSEGYFQFGQAISSHCSSSQPVLATQHYRFPMEKFLLNQGQLRSSSSSVSVESLPNGQLPMDDIVICSSDSPLREKSPPLFDDTDTDSEPCDPFPLDDGISVLDMMLESPVQRSVKLYRKKLLTLKRQPTVSTPISKLMNDPVLVPPPEEGNVSSADIFADSLVAGEVENLFEITKNVAFPHRIMVRGEAEGQPTLTLADESSDDEVQFVDETVSRVIDLGTPKSCDPNRAVVGLRTPPSSGSLNRTISPGRGWLGKGLRTSSRSPASGGNTPTTSRQPSRDGSGSGHKRAVAHIVRDVRRRRKLEDIFQSVDDRVSSSDLKRGRNTNVR